MLKKQARPVVYTINMVEGCIMLGTHCRVNNAKFWVNDMSPPEDASVLDSDVTTWRPAWKPAESTPLTDGDAQEGNMADIRVVDQNGDPVENYATGEKDVFNKQ